MGLQDRDYYKDAWKKRDRGDIHGYHNGFTYFQRNLKKSSTFNYFWLIIFTVALCATIFIFLKIISKAFA